MIPKITLIVGILGLLLGGLILVATLVIQATSNGRVAPDEAIWGYLGGCGCTFFSLIIAVVGLILVMKAQKQISSSSTTNPSPPPPPPPSV